MRVNFTNLIKICINFFLYRHLKAHNSIQVFSLIIFLQLHDQLSLSFHRFIIFCICLDTKWLGYWSSTKFFLQKVYPGVSYLRGQCIFCFSKGHFLVMLLYPWPRPGQQRSCPSCYSRPLDIKFAGYWSRKDADFHPTLVWHFNKTWNCKQILFPLIYLLLKISLFSSSSSSFLLISYQHVFLIISLENKLLLMKIVKKK